MLKKNNPNTSKHNYFRKSHKQHTKEGYKCKYTNYPRQIMYYKKDETKLHPTQKPVALMQELVLTFSNKNDTVLDFACGSGSTAIAAINTTRKFICFEKDEEHYNTAKKRINKKLRGLF